MKGTADKLTSAFLASVYRTIADLIELLEYSSDDKESWHLRQEISKLKQIIKRFPDV